MCPNVFFHNVACFRPAILIKNRLRQVFSCECCKTFISSFFIKHQRLLLIAYQFVIKKSVDEVGDVSNCFLSYSIANQVHYSKGNRIIRYWYQQITQRLTMLYFLYYQEANTIMIKVSPNRCLE